MASADHPALAGGAKNRPTGVRRCNPTPCGPRRKRARLWPATEPLAERTRLTEPQALRALIMLTDLGKIEIPKGAENRPYRVCLAGLPLMSAELPLASTLSGHPCPLDTDVR